ncbi:hypothetical protein PV963_04360 [Streptomyces coeruleorubidus]|uniref:hypothetical protein n=1 Tax=Streptomyces coeruleorubidus TaxID=116188 RepID=UPI00237EF1FA|nr:hypothetical protein [Streptomyces coeruleorubidus]WDV49652.1 hypothetical protein PV963_04360 [Streptomyces coeruleorubidus]
MRGGSRAHLVLFISGSWTAEDPVPVGHRPHGRVRAQSVRADVWVVVGKSGLVANDVGQALCRVVYEARLPAITVSLDYTEENVEQVVGDVAPGAPHSGLLSGWDDGYEHPPGLLYMHLYGHLLTAHRIARELDGLGHPAALRQLSGAGEPGNPMEKLHEAETLAEDGEFEATDVLLREELGEGLADDGWVAIVHSRLATHAAKRNDLDTAIEHARRTHELTRRTGSPGAARAAEVLDDLLSAREIRRGTTDGRRLGACREALTHAQRLSDRALFVESNRALLRLLDELDAYPEDSPARRFLGKLCGLLGLNHFHLGDRRRSKEIEGDRP